jgi:K+-sensing histidine kinase KdpD
LALRYNLFDLYFGRDAWFTVLTFWFFAVGWTAAKSTTVWQRVLVTLVLIVSLHGYFDDAHREMLVLAGFVLLIWLPAIRCPAWCTVVAGTVAEASLYTYLTHYQIYPLFGAHPLLGVLVAIVVGIVITRLANATRARLRERPRRSPTAAPVPALR